MGTKIQSVYVEELGECVDIAVITDEEDIMLFDVRVKSYTEFEIKKMERQHIADKYNVRYGKKLFKFDVENCLSYEEFEGVCKYISIGYSKLKALEEYRVSKTSIEMLEPIDFVRLATVCKYLKPCYIDGMVEETCRHKENIPTGSSWGECSSHCCPIYKK